jgi:hypothetical protein
MEEELKTEDCIYEGTKIDTLIAPLKLGHVKMPYATSFTMKA